MIDYSKDKYIIVPEYTYTIYLLPEDTLTKTELEHKGVSGITGVNTKDGSISATDRETLFKALYACLEDKTELLTIITNVINHTLEDKPFGKDCQEKAKHVMNTFDQLQELSKISYQINHLFPLKNTLESKNVTKAINDCMSKLITELLSDDFIAHKVFTRLIELGIIDNYGEWCTYTKRKLVEF